VRLRDGGQELPGGTKGCHRLFDPVGERVDDTGLGIDLVQVQPGHERVVGLEPAREGVDEVGDFGAQGSLGESGEDFRVAFALTSITGSVSSRR
jgi:hypothetical protein